MNPLAPKVGSVVQGKFTAFNQGEDGLLALAFKYDAVQPSPLEPSSRPTALVRVDDRAGEGGFGAGSNAAAQVDVGAGKRSGHQAQNVVGAERFYFGTVVEDVLRSQSPPADILTGIFLVNRFILGLPSG